MRCSDFESLLKVIDADLSEEECTGFVDLLDFNYIKRSKELDRSRFIRQSERYNGSEWRSYLEAKKRLLFWRRVRTLGKDRIRSRLRRAESQGSICDIYSTSHGRYSQRLLLVIYPPDVLLGYTSKVEINASFNQLIQNSNEEFSILIGDNLRKAERILRDLEDLERINRARNEEGIVTPPWVKYPEIERYSIGWRMGGGEDYLHAWGSWTRKLTKNELLKYFKQYAPLPIPWVDTVLSSFGYDAFDDSQRKSGAKTLEELGLTNSEQFEDWFIGTWRHEDADELGSNTSSDWGVLLPVDDDEPSVIQGILDKLKRGDDQ